MPPFLAYLVGLLTPSPTVSTYVGRFRRNPAAPSLPAQAALAARQAPGNGLRGGLFPLAGSEADYAAAQDAPGTSRSLVQELPSRQRYVAETVSNGGLRQPPLTEAYYRGPVVLPRRPWGANTGARPRPVVSWLTPPGSANRTPLPRDIEKARAQANRGTLPDLASYYGG